MELTALAIDEIRNLLALRKISAEELVRAHLERIEQKDKEVRAYLPVFLLDAVQMRAHQIFR